jgi:hypothetical protein
MTALARRNLGASYLCLVSGQYFSCSSNVDLGELSLPILEPKIVATSLGTEAHAGSRMDRFFLRIFDGITIALSSEDRYRGDSDVSAITGVRNRKRSQIRA